MDGTDRKLRAYYAREATRYDAAQLKDGDPHYLALRQATPLLRALAPPARILDVGCGTGRSLAYFAQQFPAAILAGVDPTTELLDEARKKVPAARLHVAVGQRLPFADGSFDLVVATGILHHVADPAACIREMFRVSGAAVLISDHNIFAFGSTLARRVRLILHAIGLLPAFTFVRQGFRRQ